MVSTKCHQSLITSNGYIDGHESGVLNLQKDRTWLTRHAHGPASKHGRYRAGFFWRFFLRLLPWRESNCMNNLSIMMISCGGDKWAYMVYDIESGGFLLSWRLDRFYVHVILDGFYQSASYKSRLKIGVWKSAATYGETNGPTMTPLHITPNKRSK